MPLTTSRWAPSSPSPGTHGNTLGLFAGGWSGAETDSAVAPTVAVVGHFAFTVVHGGETVLIDYERRIDGKVSYRGHGICRRGGASSELTLRWWDTERARETVLTGQEDDGRAILSTSGRVRVRWSLARVTDDLLTIAIAASPDGSHWEVQRVCTYHRSTQATR